jgi:hypothetical protein
MWFRDMGYYTHVEQVAPEEHEAREEAPKE